MFEHLARQMCESMGMDPDEYVVNPKHNPFLDTVANPELICQHRVKRWALFVDPILTLFKEIRTPPAGVYNTVCADHRERNLARDLWPGMIDVFLSNAIQVPQKVSNPIPVLQDWVGGISRRQQGVLILALRGPDGFRKEHDCKDVIRTMRACVMNSGREGRPMELGQVYATDKFMRMDLIATPATWNPTKRKFLDAIDEYNTHFNMHFLHAAAVLGFNHPLDDVRKRWLDFYREGCDVLHVNPEPEEQMRHRLRDGLRDGDR